MASHDGSGKCLTRAVLRFCMEEIADVTESACLTDILMTARGCCSVSRFVTEQLDMVAMHWADEVDFRVVWL